jgi:hypothetical protein
MKQCQKCRSFAFNAKTELSDVVYQISMILADIGYADTDNLIKQVCNLLGIEYPPTQILSK